VPDPIRHVTTLSLNLRLLEAAGACELILDDANESTNPVRSPEWWHALADRALSSLDRSAAIAREFSDVPGLGRELSLYESPQRTADTIARVLPLPEHPVSDMRRFAFVPAPLRNRYGS